MARLEELKRGATVKGVLPDGFVTVVDVSWIGSVAIELTAQPVDAGATSGKDAGKTSLPPAPTYRRFHGAVKLDSLRVGRDASRIADEIIQHLSKQVGGNVEVTLEIRADLPDGASEKTIRDVTENCRTLRFDTFGFEEA